jgi:hypothetical protein
MTHRLHDVSLCAGMLRQRGTEWCRVVESLQRQSTPRFSE